MREYYARFFREVRKIVCLFWKAQIAVSMFAGVTAPLIGWLADWTVWDVALLTAEATVAAYLMILGIFSIYAIMVAPVRLDQRRVSEIQARDDAVSGHRSTILALRDDLAKKHPHDERKEALIRDAMQKLSDQERRCLEWIANCPRVGNPELYQGGFTGEIARAIDSKTGPIIRLLVYESFRPGNRTVETDRIYSVNSEVLAALKNVLYPPPRPVTPPTSVSD
jgi:hypothetical protein